MKSARELKDLESSHDFFLSIWKSSPYSLGTTLVASIAASLTNKELAFAIFVVFLWFLSFAAFSWNRTKIIGDKISEKEQVLRTVLSELHTRREYTKSSFLFCSMNLNDYYSSHWSIPLSLRITTMPRYTSYWKEQLGQRRMKDMNDYDSVIFSSLGLLDRESSSYFENIRLFVVRGIELLELKKDRIGPIKPDDEDWMNRRLRPIWISILGKLRSKADVDSPIILTKEEAKEVKTIFEEGSAKSAYLKILDDEQLTRLAWAAETNRLESNRIREEVKGAISYLFEPPVIAAL